MPAGTRKSLHHFDYDRFLVLLKEARIRAGLSQTALAEILSLNQNYVSRSELGERRVDVREWMRWMEACGVDPFHFLRCWAAEMEPPVILSPPQVVTRGRKL